MRGDQLNDKDLFLLSLFKETPGITMREANAVLRERFDAGVSGAMFAKLKRRFEAGAAGAADEVDQAPVPAPAAAAAPAPAPSAPEPTPKPAAERARAAAPAAPAEAPRRPAPEERPPVQAAPAARPPAPPVPPADLRPVRLEVVVQEADTVHLAGSFDGWRLGERALRRGPGDRWVFEGTLPAGEHLFKYLVNGRLWFLDLERERRIDDTGVSHPLTVT